MNAFEIAAVRLAAGSGFLGLALARLQAQTVVAALLESDDPVVVSRLRQHRVHGPRRTIWHEGDEISLVDPPRREHGTLAARRAAPAWSALS